MNQAGEEPKSAASLIRLICESFPFAAALPLGFFYAGRRYREACGSFIKSQQHEGRLCSREQYGDGGLSGGTMDRPALQRLLPDIRDGKIDVAVVDRRDGDEFWADDAKKMTEETVKALDWAARLSRERGAAD